MGDQSPRASLPPQSHEMLSAAAATSYHREANRLHESRASGVFAQGCPGEGIEPGQARMLDGVPQKLSTESVSLPVVSHSDCNLPHQGLVSDPNVPDYADGFRLVRRQGHIRHMSVPVSLRHLIEQSLARPRYWGEETQIA